MTNKKVIAGVAGVAVISILSYLGYKVVKEVAEIEIEDIDWSALDESFQFRYFKDEQSNG